MPNDVSFTKLEGSKFPLGRMVVTQSALAALAHDDVLAALSRHAAGDWGELDGDDRAVNERGLLEEGRLVSVYRSASGQRFYVITEWDRSCTTVQDAALGIELRAERRDVRFRCGLVEALLDHAGEVVVGDGAFGRHR